MIKPYYKTFLNFLSTYGIDGQNESLFSDSVIVYRGGPSAGGLHILNYMMN